MLLILMLVECMKFKKMERYLRVYLLGPGPSSYKKIIYRAAVSQKLGNTGLHHVLNPLTPNDLHTRRAVSPLKIKNPSKKYRQEVLRGRI
jgi:hypothetical protein